MGICCTQGARDANADNEEKFFRANNGTVKQMDDRNGKPLSENGQDEELPEEVEFRKKTSKIKSPNENTNVLIYISL